MVERDLQKVTQGLQEIQRVLIELPRWLRTAFFVIPILGFGVGSILHWRVGAGNTGLFLSTLAIAQASILAIVFAVTVLGIQLVAQRYSPRMVSLFTEAAIFRFTFSVFVLSIAVDLLLLYTMPQQSNWWFTGLVYVAAGLGIVAVASLYTFIKISINRITPKEIAQAFATDLTPEKYFSQVRALVEDDSRHAHPAYPLKSMIMSALSNRERVTAEETLQEYGELLETRLRFFIDNDWFPDDGNKQLTRHLFKPVLEDQLHEIALHAQELEEREIAQEAVRWQYELGKIGLETPRQRVAVHAVSGLATNLMKTPLGDGGHVVNRETWDRVGDLLHDSIDHPAPGITTYILSTIRSRARRQLSQDVEPWKHEHVMLDLFRELTDSHGTLIDRHGETLAEIDLDWQHDAVINDMPNRETARLFETYLRTLTETTEAILRYFINRGFYPITEGNFRDNWQSLCTEASTSPARDYAIVLCQALIEVAYIASSIDSDEEHFWIGALQRVKEKGHLEVVDEAFDRILSYEHQDEEPPVWTIDERDEFRAKYYQNLVRVNGFNPLNTHDDFPDRIENLRRQVNEH